jgi:DNA-binding NarL/FixJ family response regulator
MTFSQPEIMAAGFDGYHSKPISAKEFLETVHAVLDGRHPPR